MNIIYFEQLCEILKQNFRKVLKIFEGSNLRRYCEKILIKLWNYGKLLKNNFFEENEEILNKNH